ncbi:MAG: hypothetical protein E7449_05985 [Ruminococcaceae bacterium]|nr:hypothetical protein [Oscillospiraceae bacterium]
MSDNVTPMHPKKKNLRKLIVRIVAAVCVLALVAAVVVVAVRNDLTDFGAVRRYFRYRNASDTETFGQYSYDAHNANRFAAYDEGLALASVGGLQLLDDYTGEIYSFHENISSPKVLTAGEFALMYDVGGTRLVLAHATRGELLSQKAAEPVLDANLTSTGAVCYIASEGNYKAVIPVYNADQQQIYTWYSASAYFNQVALSPDAKTLAAVSIGQTGAVFGSSLVILHTDSTEIQATASLGDTLVYELDFLSDNTLCAWTENGLVFFTEEAAERGRYEPGAQIEKADLNGSGFAALWLQSDLAGEEGFVVTIGADGTEKGRLAFEEQILDLSVCGGYVTVLTAQRLCVFDEAMQLYAETDVTYGATRALQRADGSVVLTASSNAVLYLP